ncbi:cobalt-precorrin-6A reductase [Streptomyces sp. NPDC047097]|uniref:cobalt-precorrin-6A reductase n=1 Tax=Streptomyces sp. NPDC047097 TaxID=3155260 RepID=UPI0033EF7591
MHLLILGGTTEARRLAEELTSPSAAPPLRVTSSLAGRVAAPRLPAGGEVRIGGFGGVEGLTRWLGEHRVDAVIDATHPFAETISSHAACAARDAAIPLLVLRRPAWAPTEGDDWHRVPGLPEAAETAARLGRRVFLTTGRMGLAAFAHLADPWFLVRSVDPPEPPHPPRLEVLLDRGPFTLDGERELLRRYAVDVLVTKDSGGAATAPKLTAAREAAIPVVIVDRPPTPPGTPVTTTVPEAAAWARALTGH